MGIFRAMTRVMCMAAIVSGCSGSEDSEPNPDNGSGVPNPPSKADFQTGKTDNASICVRFGFEADCDLCAKYDLTAPCDLCAEWGWHGDGYCDTEVISLGYCDSDLEERDCSGTSFGTGDYGYRCSTVVGICPLDIPLMTGEPCRCPDGTLGSTIR